MPYIKQSDRARILGSLFDDLELRSPGDLNYLFTHISKIYLRTNGINYQRINDIIGALEGCKLELYRRIVVPYENAKMEENGDV